MPEKEPCAFCGDEHWTEAHYAAGRLVCKLCMQGSKPAVAMAPSEAGKLAIAAWLRPRTNTPPAQQTLRHGPAVKLQWASHG